MKITPILHACLPKCRPFLPYSFAGNTLNSPTFTSVCLLSAPVRSNNFAKILWQESMTYYIVGAVVALWIIGGISRHIRRRGKTVHPVAENCTGCGKCLKTCRRHVFEMVKNGKNVHVSVKNPDKCTACGNCVSRCKFNALEIVNRNKPSWKPLRKRTVFRVGMSGYHIAWVWYNSTVILCSVINYVIK